MEGRSLASIWKCFSQHYVGESMKMFNLMLQFLLIPQWNGEQDTSRSMPGSDLQLFPIFLKTNFLIRSFLKFRKIDELTLFLKEKRNRRDARKSYWKNVFWLSPDFYICKKRAPVSRIHPCVRSSFVHLACPLLSKLKK